MTLIVDSCAIRSSCHDGQLSSSKSERLDVSKNRRKNSNFSLTSSCPCFENGSINNIKNCKSMWKSCSNLKHQTSTEKDNGIQSTQEKNKGEWSDYSNLPVYKADSRKNVCQPPCNKNTKCRAKNVCIRRVPIIPKSELKTSCAPLDKDTTYKIDYPAKQTHPPKPIKHTSALIKPSEPMYSETTYKNSYQAKPYSKRKGICPSNEMTKSCGPMQGETMTMSDYKVPQGFVPTSSFQPDNSFHPSLQPFYDKTTHKSDYVPWNTRGPVGPFPWTPGNKYKSPVVPIYGNTTYKTSYRYPENREKSKPIIPKEQGIGIAGSLFDDSTTYKNDYQPCLILNEMDCYDPNGFEICCKPPCNPVQRRPCYKDADAASPSYKKCKSLSLSQMDGSGPENVQAKVMKTPIRKHSLPIVCC